MKPWCDDDACVYNGEHHHLSNWPGYLVPAGDVPADDVWSMGGWSAPSDVMAAREAAARDPGAPPANLDGPPEPCIECDGTGRAKMRCECPQCTFPHETDCDDCQGSGMVTPWTTAQWENYAEWIRAGGVLKPLELPEVSTKRGGIRFPTPG